MHYKPRDEYAPVLTESGLYDLLCQKRNNLRIEQGQSTGKCRKVNLETIGYINRSTSLSGVVLRDPYFQNFSNYSGPGEHVIGLIDTKQGYIIGFDGTADQVNGNHSPIVIVTGDSPEEVVFKLNETLGGNFCQQVIGTNSYCEGEIVFP